MVDYAVRRMQAPEKVTFGLNSGEEGIEEMAREKYK